MFYVTMATLKTYISNICTIRDLQRRATKCIPGLAGMEYRERLRSLKLPTVAYT